MPRPINQLTAKQVTSIKKPGYHADGGGLYLRVRDNGTRTWVSVKIRAGRRTERLVGEASMTLADARAKHREPDVIAKAAAPLAPLFGAWADAFVDGQKSGWKNAKHKQQWENTLKTHAKPLRSMRVDAITTDDVLDVLRPIWKKANETARRLRGRIERILDAARAKGHIQPPYENPARWKGHLEHFLPHKKKGQKSHHAAVPWKKMPIFWKKLMARGESSSVMALRFTILTAARTGETIGATWSEVDLAAKTWTVPKERMKMGFEHAVPLTDAALAVLKVMGAAGMAPDAYIFPGAKEGCGLSNMAMLMLLKDEMGREETVHGFRSSFRDWAGDGTDYPRELAEMALAHAVGDGTEAAYRRGRAIERRRVLMVDWARYLAGGGAAS